MARSTASLPPIGMPPDCWDGREDEGRQGGRGGGGGGEGLGRGGLVRMVSRTQMDVRRSKELVNMSMITRKPVLNMDMFLPGGFGAGFTG